MISFRRRQEIGERLRQHKFQRLRDHFQFVAEGDADAFGSVIEGEDAHKMFKPRMDTDEHGLENSFTRITRIMRLQ